MVKNVKGGSGHKSQARKFVEPAKQFAVKTRIVKEDGEMYAQVTKLLGNGMCTVLCEDNKNRLCIIRGKFRGRGRRDNLLSNGKWIMVGIREYESEKAGKLDNCDLLEVYSDLDKERLKAQPGVDWKKFVENDNINSFTDSTQCAIEFTDAKEEDYSQIMEESSDLPVLVINDSGVEEEIDVDDI